MTRTLVILMLLCSPAFAEPTRVALVDTRQLFDKGGIAAWVAARAKLGLRVARYM